MSKLNRGEVIDPNEVTIAHAFSKTVRRCFLFGDDAFTGKNYDHRKVWIEDMLEHFAAFFAIDLISYAILSNHYHLVLRTRPDIVKTWDDTEVARRWLMICPNRKKDGKGCEPNQAELDSIRNSPVALAEIRERLSSLSWWMRLLNQRVAQRANREEEESGRFWRDRFKCTRLVDEASLLACSAYVDLNPIRAALAETLEESDFTSAKRRVEAMKRKQLDSFLAPIELMEIDGRTGPCPSATGLRCSDKGFLEMSREQYIELLDWTARQSARGKRGATPGSHPPILKRLGISGSVWGQFVAKFGSLFSNIAGLPEHVDAERSYETQRRFRVPETTRELFHQAS